MAALCVYADFQNLDDFNRLRLNCAGTLADLARQQIELCEGLVLTFYMDDADEQGRPDELLTEGTVHFDPEENVRVADIDWSAVHHTSEISVPGVPTSNSSNGTSPHERSMGQSR